MKYIGVMLTTLLFASCGNDINYYVTNNVLEAEIVNVQSERAGKIILNKLERGIQFKAGETIIVIDTTLIVQEKQVLLARLESLNANEQVLLARKQTLKENIKYFQDQTNKWKRLAASQAGPEQRAEDFEHQLVTARLQYNELQAQIRTLDPERRALRAQLKAIDETIEKHKVKAPIDGKVVDKYVYSGEVISPGLPLGQMANENKLHVYLYWPIDMIGKFKIGDKVDLHIDGSDNVFTSEISWVSPIAEFTPKIVQSTENRAQMAYQVRLEVPNPDGFLKIGQPVEARLPWMEEE